MLKWDGERVPSWNWGRNSSTIIKNNTQNSIELKKVPGHDGIHGFWFLKKITSIHQWLALQISRWVNATRTHERLNSAKTILIQSSPPKYPTMPSIYWSIPCLSKMRKIVTASIREEIYSILCQGLFLEVGQRWHRGKRRTSNLMSIDQHIPKERKKRWINVAMLRVDNKKDYTFPQTWVIDCSKMLKISDKVIKFIT